MRRHPRCARRARRSPISTQPFLDGSECPHRSNRTGLKCSRFGRTASEISSGGARARRRICHPAREGNVVMPVLVLSISNARCEASSR